MAETLGQAVLEVGVDDSRLRAGLAGVEGQVRRTTSIVGELGGVIAGIGAVTAFGGLINAASELETITRKLANTLGDQGAQQALGFTRELSDRLGLSFTVLSDSFAGFTAAASAANIPLQEQQGLFEAVSTSAQRLGLSNDAINGSLLALQQVAAKGTVQMEELRGQLGERLPTAFAATAQGLGISNKELIKLVESGKLTADEFFPALTKGLTELNGTGPAGVPTAQQNFASFANELRTLQAEFGKEFLPGVVEATRQIGGFLQGFRASQRAADLGGAFGFGPNEAQQLAGQLDFVEKKFGLTREQSKNITSDAIEGLAESVGGIDVIRNKFGNLVLEGGEFADLLSRIEDRARSFTAGSRASVDAQQRAIVASRDALKADEKRLDTLDKINNRLKAARKELGGLDPDSGAAADKRAEIEALQARTPEGAQKASREIQKAAEEAVKKSKELADNYIRAADAVKSANQSFQGALENRANATAAASDIASFSAIREDRGVLLGDISSNLASGRVDQRRLAQRFGLGFNPNGGFVQGLEGLDINRLSEISRATSPLADSQTAVVEAQKELVKTQTELSKLREELKVANGRTSNLAITVPVGATRNIYLP